MSHAVRYWGHSKYCYFDHSLPARADNKQPRLGPIFRRTSQAAPLLRKWYLRYSGGGESLINIFVITLLQGDCIYTILSFPVVLWTNHTVKKVVMSSLKALVHLEKKCGFCALIRVKKKQLVIWQFPWIPLCFFFVVVFCFILVTLFNAQNTSFLSYIYIFKNIII